MAGSYLPSPMGLCDSSYGNRRPGPLGNQRGEPLSGIQMIGNTPGPLGTGDWADPNLQTSEPIYLAQTIPFNLTLLPAVMRARGYNTGAYMMERWFSGYPNDKPLNGIVETTTVKMDWVLGFARARSVYDEMIRQKIWCNPPAQQVIIERLKAHGKFTDKFETFGDFSRPAPTMEKHDYINSRPMVTDKLLDPIDDLFATLGSFEMRMVAKGTVQPKGNGKYRITIKEVGVFVRDSYDFNTNQTLGYWDVNTNSVGKTSLSGTEVTNAHFRAWRQANNKGCDFLIFSDVKVHTLLQSEYDYFDAPVNGFQTTPGSPLGRQKASVAAEAG